MTWGYVIAACWIGFLVYWIVSAPRVKATAEKQDWLGIIGSRLLLIPGAFLIFSHHPPKALDVPLFGSGTIANPAGAVTCICGVICAVWSRRTLAGNWSATVTFKEGHELVQRGPYRFVRHPIYTGILTMCLGTAVANGRLSCMAGLLLYFVSFWIKSRQEEALLLRHFPNEYPAYKARVKALIPFIF